MTKAQLANRTDEHIHPVDFREKWLNEIRRARRVYSFQLWADQREERNISLSELLRWIREDIKYAFVNSLNILLNLRKYGSIIKKEYRLSYLKQGYRMAYLVFVIRTQAFRFRLNHLFEKSRWERAKNHAYSRHIRAHNLVLGYPHRDDIDIIAHKLKFHIHCSKHGLPTPDILAVYESGKQVSSFGDSKSLPKINLFMKELSGGMGYGIKKFSCENGIYLDSNGKKYSEDELRHFFKEYSLNTHPILIQKALKNHDTWKEFTSGGLATCRVVTGKSPINDEEVIPFFATFKMPVQNLYVDNFSKGSVAAPIDLETGRMGVAVASLPQKGKFRFEYHPDTGRKIRGEVLPFWREVIELSKKVHQHFKTIDIGWDIALTEDGLTVLEGNVEWGSDVIEGPGTIPIADTIYPEWFDGWVKRRRT